MSVSGTDYVNDTVDSITLAISTQVHDHEQPTDVSITADKSSSESALEIPLLLPKEDASNLDVSANADSSVSGPSADAANGHAPTADAVPQVITAHSEENGETDNTTDALLGSPSDSVVAENPAVTAENESVKEVDDVLAADVVDDATIAEDQGPSTSESVTVLVEESLADKTINDSAIEIPPPALEKKEDGKDNGFADKPDVGAVEPAMEGESAVDTQVDVPHVEEVAQVEEIKDVVPAESDAVAITDTEPSSNEGDLPVSITEAQEGAAVDGATAAVEKAGIDQIPEEQPQTEVTLEEMVAEVDKPEVESGAVGGIEQEETAHEAEPIAAEVNNVGNDNHEAVEQPIVEDEHIATEEANGNKATLEQLDEQPEVTVQVETTPFVEEPQVDGVVDDAAVEQVEELAGEGVTVHAEAQAVAESAVEETEDIPAAVVEEVQGPIVNDEAPTAEAEPVEVTAEEVPLSVEAGENTSEATPVRTPLAEVAIDETPASIEAELVTEITREEESAPAEPVVAAEVDEEVTAAVEAEAASEEALAPVTIEAIAEDASVPTEDEVAIEETSVPVEATSEEPPVVVEAEVEAVAREETPVVLEAEPTAEVTASDETAAPVEPEPVVDKEAPVTVEAEPAIEVATNEETPALVAVEAEPAVEVGASEETSAPVEVEPVVSEEITGAVQAESVVEAAGEEASLTVSKPTTDVTSEEAPAPVKAEVIASETTPIEIEPVAEVTEVAAPIAVETFSEIASQDTSAPAEAELIPETVNEETSTAIESEANSEETPGPAPVEAEPATQPDDEVLPIVEVTAPAETEVANGDASESKPVTDSTGEIESSGPVGAELVTTAATHEDDPVHVDEAEVPLGEVSSEVEEIKASEIASAVEANPEPVAEISASEAAPVEVQDVPCEDNIISVEADDAPVGVAQKEIAVEETPATVDPTEPSTEGALGRVADTEPESLVEPTLYGQEVSETGIKDDAEVALEGASIALATNAVEETLSAVSSESVKEANVEMVHDEAPTLAQNGHLSDVLEPPITVPAGEQQTETIEDDAVDAEPLTGLKTENLYVQTALDTTTFTPIVDSGIELKEHESQPSHLLSIAEEIERPKSPWSPSFQVTTIGHREFLEEDAEKAPIENDFKTEKFADVVAAATPVLTEEVAEQEPLASVASEDTADGQPLEPSAEPWTASYSVHLQGVLTQTNAKIAPMAEEQHAADDVVPAETVAAELQAEPDAVESEIKMEDDNEQVPETVVVQESTESGNETKENIDVVSTDTTEPPTEEIAASATVIALADEGVNKAPETSSHEEESLDSLVDTLESSVKTWTTSYSAQSQGASTVLEETVTPAANTKPLEVESSLESKEQAAELPILSVSTESIESAVLEAPTESWTPSYSVHSQGSIPPAELDVASTELEPTADEQPTVAWAPSYSVHSQGSPLVAAKELEASEFVTPEPPYRAHSQGTPPVTSKDLEETPTHDVESTEFVALQDPWTSPPVSKDISVAEIVHHSQSDDAMHTTDLQDEQVYKNTEATLIDVVAPVIAIAAVEAAADSLTTVGESDSATCKIDATSSADKITRPVLSVSLTNTESNNATTDVVDQPWTPSYSVMHQGSSLSLEGEDKQESQPIAKGSVSGDLEPQLNEVQEPNAVQLRPEYNVTGAENFAQNEKFMLFGLRALVAYLWVLPKWLSMSRSPSESSHSRQDSSSSSSSKFFPGGWFTPKPNEGRTSLDVAQGEFAPSPKVTTTTDVFETLNVQNEAGASTSPAIDGDVDGQKRKWCVVM